MFFNFLIRPFAVIAVLVAVFSIYNTFSIIVAQRTREMALLRALGAARRQVLLSVSAKPSWSASWLLSSGCSSVSASLSC